MFSVVNPTAGAMVARRTVSWNGGWDENLDLRKPNDLLTKGSPGRGCKSQAVEDGENSRPGGEDIGHK